MRVKIVSVNRFNNMKKKQKNHRKDYFHNIRSFAIWDKSS